MAILFWVLMLVCMGCSRISSSPPERLVQEHPTSIMMRTFFDDYAALAQKSLHLRYLGEPELRWGARGTPKDFGARVMYQGCLEKEEARKLFVEAVQQFVDFVNSRENVRNYLGHPPFTMDRLVFFISFWDEHMDRPKAPCVAQISFENNELRYRYKREDSEALSDREDVESYAEAKALAEKSR